MEERSIVSLIRTWLEEVKKRTVKAATYDRLVVSLRMIESDKELYSESVLEDWTPRFFQGYLNHLKDNKYSISTIKKQYNLVTAYMKYAYAMGVLKNPVYLVVKVPSENTVKIESESYSPEEQKKLVSVLESYEHPAYAAALFMLETGLRIGEALALSWNDVIFPFKALIVNKTLVRMSTGRHESYIQNGAKSRSSNRRIPLSDKAVIILEKRYKDGFMGDIDGWSQHGTNVFGDTKPLTYSSVKYWVRKACRKAGVPYKGLHAFRHTFASNCYNRGADVKLLSKLLGHSSVSITYNTYIHLFGDELEKLRQVVQ